MGKIKCPCCSQYTIDDSDEVIVDICDVCYWQYDWVAQKYPDKVIGPNKVSLNEAIVNYKKYGVSDVNSLTLMHLLPALSKDSFILILLVLVIYLLI